MVTDSPCSNCISYYQYYDIQYLESKWPFSDYIDNAYVSIKYNCGDNHFISIRYLEKSLTSSDNLDSFSIIINFSNYRVNCLNIELLKRTFHSY